MKLSIYVVFLGTAAAGPVYTPSGDSSAKTDALAWLGVAKLAKHVEIHGPANRACTNANVAVRREWSTLTTAEKKAYISAVQCLTKKPAKTPSSIAPGAKTRYDDFVATHINQTFSIHGTGNFLSWHRYFTWSYEQALRTECGYKGYQPYYSWPKWSSNPARSPVFDGSETSLSGNGAKQTGRSNTCIPSVHSCNINIPPGNGGGCVTSGPFKNFSVNLGPVAPVLTDINANPAFTGLGYNPRCLRRDISQYATSRWSTDAEVSSLISNYKDFASFSTRMQGDFPHGFLGVHTAGHFTAGGDPGGDLFASPGDPYFYLHHAMIDRVWWIWQAQDIANRQNAIGNTITVNNSPPSRNATLDDPLDMGTAGQKTITIRDAASTVAGPFCYVYA